MCVCVNVFHTSLHAHFICMNVPVSCLSVQTFHKCVCECVFPMSI